MLDFSSRAQTCAAKATEAENITTIPSTYILLDKLLLGSNHEFPDFFSSMRKITYSGDCCIVSIFLLDILIFLHLSWAFLPNPQYLLAGLSLLSLSPSLSIGPRRPRNVHLVRRCSVRPSDRHPRPWE